MRVKCVITKIYAEDKQKQKEALQYLKDKVEVKTESKQVN